MEPQRWRRAQEIFHAALEAAEAQRGDLIAQASAGDVELELLVLELLEADREATTFIDRPAYRLETGPDQGERAELPDAIGPYRPLEILGRGGMGVVYLAERADQVFDKRIALKVVDRDLATPELARRFRAERQILADLEHESIARLLDGGTTEDGRPYLVMEYVDGLPVDRFVAQRGLPLEARLELFVRICRAVQTAHQNLIVHRDLKPGNILVTADGRPKLLDFGIAKLLTQDRRPGAEDGDRAGKGDRKGGGGGHGRGHGRASEPIPTDLTAPGARLMTPTYASPEQLRGGTVTTASDIYSLGVLLYEMLTGTTPHGTRPLAADPPAPAKPSEQLGERARETGDHALARLRRAVDGDLDLIVLAALREVPAERYRSVEALAADVERWLAGLPVTVREPTLGYRTERFVKRHRWSVSAVVLAFAALSSLTVSNVLQSRQTAGQRDRAEAVSDFMVRLFQNADPRHARGEEITVRELLDEAARSLERQKQPPEVLAELWSSVGEAYLGLGLYQPAGEYLDRALEHRRRLHGDEHPEVAAAVAVLGRLRLAEGDLAGADEWLGRALEQRRALLGERHVDTGQSLLNLATLRHRQNRLEASDELFRRAIDTLEDFPGAEEMLARALSGLAALERDRSRFAEAEQLQRRALEVMSAERGPAPDPAIERLRTGLGTLLRRQGNDDDAERVYRQALAAQRSLYPAGHPDIAVTLSHLSAVAMRQGRFDEADDLLEEAARIRVERLGPSHPLVANTLNNRANLSADRDRPDEAERLYREALRLQLASLPEGHQDIAKTRTNLGVVLAQRGRYGEADELHRQALAAYRQLYGDHHADVAVVANNFAQSLKAQGRVGEARVLLETAVGTLRAVLGAEHPRLAIGLNNLAALYAREGSTATAQAAYDEAIAIAEKRFGPEHPATLRFHLNRLLAADLENAAPALEAAARALLGRSEESLGADDRITAEVRGLLGEILSRRGEHRQAESLLRLSLEQLETLEGVPEKTLEKARRRSAEAQRRRSG